MNDRRLQEAIDAVRKDRSADAVDLLLPLARLGDIRAQALLGAVYIKDEKVLDVKEAVKWLESAAAQGNGNAAHNLGILYMTSLPGMEVDMEKSKKWLSISKELGYEETIASDPEWYLK